MANPYQAPLELIRIALDQAADVTGARSLPGYEEVLTDLAEPILENASRFAGDVLSPLNPVGDRTPSRCEANGVITPPGFVDAYRRFREDGWVSLALPTEYGGQGLSTLLSAAVTEMWGGANLAFAMCPELAAGAINALQVHATQQLVDTYAERIASGEWASSMCLTEPQAGSDLSPLRTRAQPDGDAWRLYGRKIYISWGDHDLTDNIVHFVLARTPDAPPGLKGISLFLVPKKLPDGTRNDIATVSVEHKMGIKASPTCAMALGENGGAQGWLIGKLHDGLGCMFTMMNHMRLGVGLHSLGLAERSLQLARTYAHERLQGRNAQGSQRPIIEHADVRRMLLLMKSLVQAARGLAYTAAATLDVAHSANSAHSSDPGNDVGAHSPVDPASALRRADLLTPIVKAWISDLAVEVASLGVQVHGGMGFVDDAEISQLYRDSRIGPIFEGTNYIQAQDLLGRKVLKDQGKVLGELLTDIERAAHALSLAPQLRAALLDNCARVRAVTQELVARSPQEPDLIGTTAYNFLHWLGLVTGGWQLALAATAAKGNPSVVDLATFYATHVLPRSAAHEAIVRYGTLPVTRPALSDI